MHKTTFPHASRIFAALAALALLLLTGCDLTITNVTPETVPANPSQIYTITARFELVSSGVIPESVHPRIVIDGQSYNMTRTTAGSDLWEFEYQLPAGRTATKYYFIADYDLHSGVSHEKNSDQVYVLNIAGRYVLRPEANRAPVGSRVSVLGAGFTPSDVVFFDFTPTRTVFESPSSLSFFVPAIDPGHSYSVSVRGGGNELSVGAFRVDAISFQVNPSSLTLRSGEQKAITFTIPNPAPAGGMLVDVTTDVPESVIMPEVMITAGAVSVTVPVQGGKPGSGAIYFRSSAGESSIPLTVNAR